MSETKKGNTAMKAPQELYNLIEALKEAQQSVDALSAAKRELEKEKRNIDKIISDIKDQIITIFISNNKKTLDDDNVNIVIKAKPVKPVVIDENLVPDEYFEQRKVLSKTAINDAWANGIRMDGVALDNGGYTMAVKWKDI
jgi:hypothetical protein